MNRKQSTLAILHKIYQITLILLTCVALSSCWTWKRSDCPTYRDSDPDILFGKDQKSFGESLDEQEKAYKPKSKKSLSKRGKKQRKKAAKRKKKRR